MTPLSESAIKNDRTSTKLRSLIFKWTYDLKGLCKSKLRCYKNIKNRTFTFCIKNPIRIYFLYCEPERVSTNGATLALSFEEIKSKSEINI